MLQWQYKIYAAQLSIETVRAEARGWQDKMDIDTCKLLSKDKFLW